MKNERQIDKAEKKVSVLEGVVCCPAGDVNAPVFKIVYDEKLKKNIVKQVDTFNIYEFIQASKSSTDLATLQKRWLELGEVPGGVLGFDGDVDMTLYPCDIHGVYKMVNDVDGAFNRLPESIQKIFGNKDAYLKALLDGSFNASVIAAVNNQAPQEKPEEV